MVEWWRRREWDGGETVGMECGRGVGGTVDGNMVERESMREGV